MRIKGWIIAALALVGVGMNAAAETGEFRLNRVIQAVSENSLDQLSARELSTAKFIRENPDARFHMVGSQFSRIYGGAFTTGLSPVQSAERFCDEYAEMFGVSSAELIPAPPVAGASHIQPLMLDRTTGDYKFMIVFYRQFKDGYPVFRSQVGLLVRNRGDYPLVMASADLKDLGDFVPPQSMDAAAFDPGAHIVGFGNFSDPELMVFAGVDGIEAEPRLAAVFIGDNGRNDDLFEKYRFVCDVETGDILHKETLIYFADVVGNVGAIATPGARANICDDEIPFVFPWARVEVDGGNSAYTDVDGNFTIPHSGTTPIDVHSFMDGLYFTVINWDGIEETLTSTLTPGVPGTFMHNETNTDDMVLAQTNIYVSANICRDWVLSVNPTFPGVCTETDVVVYVNRTDGHCPCNAWSDGGDGSVSFCQPEGSCPNTAWQSVFDHEYGHHCIDFTASGQGEYGEGISDAFAMLPVDDPNLAFGFYGDCNAGLRTADNDCQYIAGSPCSSCGNEVHDCGMLLSGVVWDIRNELAVTEPDDYLDILSDIVVNSIMLHSGTGIDAQIAIDFLKLDDDDDFIENGTPHYDEICAGFLAHGIDCPALSPGLSVVSRVDYEPIGEAGGPFTPSSKDYLIRNHGPDPLEYAVTCNAIWADISNGVGSLPNVGDEAIVTITTNSVAGQLAEGLYTAPIVFMNTTDSVGNTTLQAKLRVGLPNIVYEWTLDSDPGWTTSGLWEFGQPSGEGSYYGDPSSGYTGTNVYGYNLDGDYTNNMPSTYLTTAAFDCTELADVTLKFQRWLGVESGDQYDDATIEVSTDGLDWNVIWRASDTGDHVSDNSWQPMEYSIAQIADDQPTVYVRWGMGPTDAGLTYPGWNIDDVSIVAIGGGLPALKMSFPNGEPRMMSPGVPTVVDVEILDGTEPYVPGSATLFYRLDDGEFQAQPMSSIGGNIYRGTLPATVCDATPAFYITALGDGGTTAAKPKSAPVQYYTPVVGSLVPAFEDNFETDMGWVAENLGATAGDWQRGVPVNDPSWQYDPESDGDGSGSCYLTQNVIGNSDVDGGAVRLTSPVIDMSSGLATISYYYFLRLTNVDGTDKLHLEVNSTGGSGVWITLEEHKTDGGLLWRSNTITQNDLDSAGVTLTDSMVFRFTTNDDGTSSIVETGIDGFRVEVLGCEDIVETGACCMGDETCIDGQTVADCTAVGGWFLGPATTCGTSACPCVGPMGDVNNDGLVNGLDIQGFIDALLGDYSPCCDFDADEDMSTADIQGMLQALGV